METEKGGMNQAPDRGPAQGGPREEKLLPYHELKKHAARYPDREEDRQRIEKSGEIIKVIYHMPYSAL